jgi:hypothetical protein
MINVFIIFTNEKNTTIYDNTILKFFWGFQRKKRKEFQIENKILLKL